VVSAPAHAAHNNISEAAARLLEILAGLTGKRFQNLFQNPLDGPITGHTTWYNFSISENLSYEIGQVFFRNRSSNDAPHSGLQSSFRKSRLIQS